MPLPNLVIAGAPKSGNVAKGEEVFTQGYPLIAIQGQEQKATFGRINALSGYERLKSHFTLETYIEKVSNIYQRLLP
jgi:hypothetical protein